MFGLLYGFLYTYCRFSDQSCHSVLRSLLKDSLFYKLNDFLFKYNLLYNL